MSLNHFGEHESPKTRDYGARFQTALYSYPTVFDGSCAAHDKGILYCEWCANCRAHLVVNEGIFTGRIPQSTGCVIFMVQGLEQQFLPLKECLEPSARHLVLHAVGLHPHAVLALQERGHHGRPRAVAHAHHRAPVRC